MNSGTQNYDNSYHPYERMKRYQLRIAYVGPPITLDASGLAYRTSFSPLRRLFEQYDITYFGYKVYKTTWMKIGKVYMHAIKWLLCLPLHLINGRFHLFMTGVLYPEAFITFFVGKLLRKPIIILDYHWCWSNTFISKFLWPVGRFVAKNSTILIVVPRSKMFWRLAGVPDRRMRIAPLRVVTLEVKDEDITLAERLKENLGKKKVILYFGRLLKYKGVEYLIKAFAKLSKENRSIMLLIAGEGDEKPYLEKICEDMKLSNNVYFAGFVREEDKVLYFLLCDIFVLPSITLKSPEEWGLVVNEAMCVGKPVVVTNAVGCAYDLVKNGVNGYIVPEKDVDALCNAIKIIIENKELRDKMGKASREIIKEFFTDDCAVKSLNDAIIDCLYDVLKT